MSKILNCTPAVLVKAHASWFETAFGGLLVIHAFGKVNTPCMNLHIEKSPITIWPPMFNLCQYEDFPQDPCPQVITEKETCGYFYLPEPPKFIYLSHAGGVAEVPVVPNGECECPIPLSENLNLKPLNDDERTGWSHISRQDALDNALFQFLEKDSILPQLVTEVVSELALIEFNHPVYAVTLRKIY